MLNKILYKISAERIDIDDPYLPPFFFQQQKAYSFCQKYIKNKIVLEIGSGSGYGAYRLSKYTKKVIALDKDATSIKKSKKRYGSKNLTFISSTIERYKTNQKFDVIILFQVIEHIQNVQSLFETILPLLKKKGLLILSTPNASTQSYNENPYHFKEYNSNELTNLLNGYFNKTILYGIHGDSKVHKYEQLRKKQVTTILNKDILNLRRFIPKIIKQYLFDFFSYIRKIRTKKNTNYSVDITEKNFNLNKKYLNESIDLIAVCKQ